MQPLLDQATTLHQQGRLSEAAVLYRQALAAAPGHPRAGYLLALLHYQQGEGAEALAGVNAVLRTMPDLADALMLRGAILLQDNPHQALNDFREVTARQPGHGEAWYNQGVVLARLDRNADAIGAFERTLQIRPAAAAWSNKGIAQLALGLGEDALASFDQALALDPGFAGALYNRATTLLQLQRPAEALAAFEAYLKLAPDAFEAWNNRGAALQMLERREEAAESYGRATAIRADYAPAWKNGGLVLTALERHAEAAAAFRRATTLMPGDAQAWNGQGEVLRHLKRYDEALASYRKALTLTPDDAGVWYQYAGTLQAGGPLGKALAAAEKSLALAPDNFDALALRGSLLIEQNRVAEGLESFQRHALLSHGMPGAGGSDHKQRHDAEQRAWLAREGVTLAEGQYHVMAGARLVGPAVNPANSAAISAQWQTSQPQIVIIDNLLTPEALGALRRFCWGSTIWRRPHANGYLGAMPEYGFACPLLAQIADELRETFPAIFGAHGLVQLWGFKYDSTLRGINMHADQAVVNVNFWITPDEANRNPENGGLVIWDKSAPLDWEFSRYNSDEGAARQFLAQAGARPVTVPYRANRAVIFDSDLFHETDTIEFRDGYLNRRINVTMLYGRRNFDGS